MTEREREVLELCRRFFEEERQAPSIKEISGVIGVTRQRAQQIVQSLEQRGLVVRGVVPLPLTSGET